MIDGKEKAERQCNACVHLKVCKVTEQGMNLIDAFTDIADEGLDFYPFGNKVFNLLASHCGQYRPFVQKKI